ncbi:MAG: hypothetical protein O7D91_17695 [Planctomycetota bacterium]|nr:hypothetical protein [Planctomycetota bacterium]
MKQAEVKIGMKVYKRAAGRNRYQLWTVDGIDELPLSTGQHHKWRLSRVERVDGEMKTFTTVAISASLSHE